MRFRVTALQRDEHAEQKQAMNLEPQEFYIGLVDFCSIVLPGALFTYLLMGKVGGRRRHVPIGFFMLEESRD